MKKINNETRRMAGANAIQNHMNDIDGMKAGDLRSLVKEDKIDAITDTIADILHYAESIGIKIHLDIFRRAQRHVMYELEQEGKE